MEVFYRGQWGSICDYDWDLSNVKVVCRQLGYQYGVKAFEKHRNRPGSGKIWLEDVDCTGSEKNLTSCGHSGWGNHDCSGYWNAWAECSSKGKIRVFCELLSIFAKYKTTVTPPKKVYFRSYRCFVYMYSVIFIHNLICITRN